MGLSVNIAINRNKADCSTANSPVRTEASTGSAMIDDLPPFAQLVSDEDREKKAEQSSPGTYHVVVKPDSFQHLPEYSGNDALKQERLLPIRRGSFAASLASSLGKESSTEGIPEPGDPNVVVLPRFEDVAKRTGKGPRSPACRALRRVKTEEEECRQSSEPEHEGNEEKYIRQFRQVVWKQLIPVEMNRLDGMEGSSAVIVETEAQFFPPVRYKLSNDGLD
jgi:hypothetical protein